MKKRYNEEQIVQILKEAASKGDVAGICRKYGISDVTYSIWRKKYDGMNRSDLHKLRLLKK